MSVVVLATGHSVSVKADGLLAHSPFFQTYLLLVCFFFYAGFWVHGEPDVGMRAWRLRLQARDGRCVGNRRYCVF